MTRNPREKLFELGRCLAHFAVDDHEVRFCTHLKGKESWFLPFNRGWDGGRGNPPNPNGLKTDYLWKETLTRGGLTDIIENYAQIVEGKDDKTGRKTRDQIWPRYHQLDVVRKLLADVSARGAGRIGTWSSTRPEAASPTPSRGSPTSSSGSSRTARSLFDSVSRRHGPEGPRPADTGTRSSSSRRSAPSWAMPRAPATFGPFCGTGRTDRHHHRAEVPVHPGRHRQRAPRPPVRHHHRRGPFEPRRAHVGVRVHGAGRGRRGRGGRDQRGQDQPADGVQEAPAQRQLLRLHGNPEEQDTGDIRRACEPAGEKSQTSPLPRPTP